VVVAAANFPNLMQRIILAILPRASSVPSMMAALAED
jgi:hypothetical protein